MQRRNAREDPLPRRSSGGGQPGGRVQPQQQPRKHHENASTETGHTSPWAKPRHGQPDEEESVLLRPIST